MKIENLKVLLVEDDQTVRLTVKAMLLDIGITDIFEATDGMYALDFMNAEIQRVDIIICDWNMPNKTGFEFLRDVRETYPDLPFLMMTARADESSVLDAIGAGVTGYLRKPFLTDEMRSALRKVCSI